MFKAIPNALYVAASLLEQKDTSSAVCIIHRRIVQSFTGILYQFFVQVCKACWSF